MLDKEAVYAANPERKHNPVQDEQKLQVLHIDDESAVLGGTEIYLQGSTDISYTPVHNEAFQVVPLLSRLGEVRKLLVSDIQMATDGKTVAEIVRKFYPGVPIAFYSGSLQRGLRAKAATDAVIPDRYSEGERNHIAPVIALCKSDPLLLVCYLEAMAKINPSEMPAYAARAQEIQMDLQAISHGFRPDSSERRQKSERYQSMIRTIVSLKEEKNMKGVRFRLALLLAGQC